ncbi:MAG: septum formation initiator family protein [Candidatus Aminicenantes bacterium]|nr:septum formation initiator family protein [Candidatus Aminicenantes bacterium]
MKTRKKIFLSLIILLLFVLVLSTFFGKRGFLQIREARNQQINLQREIVRLKQEKEKLEKEVEELRQNPHMIEEEARKKLWLMRPDEKVLILPKSKDKNQKQ